MITKRAFFADLRSRIEEHVDVVTAVSRQVLIAYLNKQIELLQTLDQCTDVDLRHTSIPISMGVKFNLGDALKVLVYHDELHFGQARSILADMDITGAKHV